MNHGIRPIRIGLLHSLSGTMALSERSLLDAELMAIEEINRAGGLLGRPLEAVTADGASDPEEFGRQAARLLEDGIETLFGCWTSASRKIVKEKVEAADGQLWYPIQYEGLEESNHIVYTGCCPNQQILPAVEWLIAGRRERVYLLGSDYVFPHAAHRLIRSTLDLSGSGMVAGETCLPLGCQDFGPVLDAIRRLKPDALFNTLNGDSNIAFFRQLWQAGLGPDEVPVLSVSIGETEIQSIVSEAEGHYLCWEYFQSLDNPLNSSFIERFRLRFGADRVCSSPVVMAYSQLYLWKEVVERAQAFHPSEYRPHLPGSSCSGPAGAMTIERNHHLAKVCHIGKVLPNGQVGVVWSSAGPIVPYPWLGMEAFGFSNIRLVKDTMAAFTDSVHYESLLKKEIEAHKQTVQKLNEYRNNLEHMVETKTSQLKNAYQHLLDTSAANRKITDEIAAAELRFRQIADATNQWIWETDAEGLYTYSSEACRVILGYAPEEVVGKKYFYDLFLPGVRERLKTEALAAMAEGKTFANFTNPCLHKDGRTVYLQTSGVPVLDGKGQILGYRGVDEDVSHIRQAEESLLAGEALYRNLFETMAQGVVYQDAAGVITDANPAAERILGLSLAQMQGRTSVDPRWQALREDGTPFPGEEHPSMVSLRTGRKVEAVVMGVMHPASRIHRWLLVDAVPRFRDGEPAPYQVYTTFTDISERIRHEEEMRILQERYYSLFEGAADAIFIHDGEARILMANRAAAERLGYTQEELQSMTVDQVDVPEEASHVAERIERLGKQGFYSFESVHRRKDGSRIPVDVSARVIVWDGNPAAMSICRDITERKQAEAALLKSEEQTRDILLTALDGYWLADGEGRLLDVNDSYCLMSGFSRQELLSMSIGDIDVAMSPEEIAGRMAAIIDSAAGCRFESRHLRRDGTFMDMEVSVRYRPYDGGRFVSFLRDISERKQAENERMRLETQLQQAQKMESVGRLAGGVAHDFNNMLSVILGHAEMALMKKGAELLQGHLDEIKKAAERSANLTRQLLAFARKQTIEPKILDLNDTVAGMLKMLQRLIGENIKLTWSPGAGLWPVHVDPSQIDQLLANLCVNAKDAMGDQGSLLIGTANVSLERDDCLVHADCRPGDYVRIAVADDGAGMDRETLSRIFEPFFTTKGLGKGTGLGLATVYGIMKQNDGFIDVSSEPGKGSTFSLFLPRHHAQAAEESRTVQERKPPRGNETILVVEDEEAVLDLTTAMLEALGYRIVKAKTPGQALGFAAQSGAAPVDLLITDVVMPEMNGRELAARMELLYPGLKQLFMSGYTADMIARQGVLEEGIHFIRKPFSVEEVALKVRAILDGNHEIG